MCECIIILRATSILLYNIVSSNKSDRGGQPPAATTAVIFNNNSKTLNSGIGMPSAVYSTYDNLAGGRGGTKTNKSRKGETRT